jgi:hypothetical protein
MSTHKTLANPRTAFRIVICPRRVRGAATRGNGEESGVGVLQGPRFATYSIARSHRFDGLHDRADPIYVLGENGANASSGSQFR